MLCVSHLCQVHPGYVWKVPFPGSPQRCTELAERALESAFCHIPQAILMNTTVWESLHWSSFTPTRQKRSYWRDTKSIKDSKICPETHKLLGYHLYVIGYRTTNTYEEVCLKQSRLCHWSSCVQMMPFDLVVSGSTHLINANNTWIFLKCKDYLSDSNKCVDRCN